MRPRTFAFTLLLMFIFGLAVGLLHNPNSLFSSPKGCGQPSTGSQPTFDDLLDAIEQVESGGDSNAIGDNGNAIGAYQIWKIYVDDVNRILRRPVYVYDDRWDGQKSRGMVSAYLRHYGGTIEEMARKHNGGPTGHKKESTLKYWTKVKGELK